ncbi:PAS domain-containing sensor histidine kinase [Roseospira marina]|uniref:histidine kinase n=1 Tax=Roseospira marina TaxID=140057 RepID=A0A5M6IBH6_9PROT|nr:PAS domain-containing sensor histidine kinase [Roseospira marina]KAA5605650.1 PAS domain-containing sensor histidine kinase [Roseospira marina]MBB4313274.1 signal transduction histidine kinase [Roseospira marina]MBB5085985.1 signal transduction histidine kinase [Roseospira marina]
MAADGMDAVSVQTRWDALTLLDALGVPVYIKDTDLRFTASNVRHAARVLGRSRMDVVGRMASEIIGVTALVDEDHDRALLAEAETGSADPCTRDMAVSYADGTRGHARVIKTVMRDEVTGIVTGLTGMLVDTTADQAQVAALSRAAAHAEHASAEKDRFLGAMSQQLRTPLNTIIESAEALGQGAAGRLTPGQRDVANGIVAAGRHMEAVFAVVPDIARPAASGHRGARGRVDLRALAADVIQRALPDATAAGVTLGFQVDEALTGRSLRADGAAIRHILHNLIANALAFTAAGGRVDLSLRLDRERLLLQVGDTGGGGAAAGRIRRMLIPSASREGSAAGESHDAGVGLTIVKTLVGALGGVFDLHSVPGRGTTATVRLAASRLGPGPTVG